jgi:hypothetical protein
MEGRYRTEAITKGILQVIMAGMEETEEERMEGAEEIRERDLRKPRERGVPLCGDKS